MSLAPLRTRLGLPPPIIIGHRGAGQNSEKTMFVENTIPSFQEAKVLGAEMIETDCQLTQDGKVMLWHDNLIKGKKMTDYTETERQSLPPHICPLDLLFNTFKKDIYYYLELKIPPHYSIAMIHQLSQAVLDQVISRQLQDMVMIVSFNLDAIRYCQTPCQDQSILLGVNVEEDTLTHFIQNKNLLHYDAICPDMRLLTPDFIATHCQSKYLVPFNVNSKEAFTHCLTETHGNIHGITTDHISDAINFFKKQSKL